MVETILSNPFVTEMILPFLLIFVLVFAILQKTKLLGEGKTQIDAIISLVVALMFVGIGKYIGFINNLIPILAVALVVILVFLLLLGGVWGKVEIGGGLKTVLGVLAGVVVIVALIYASNAWSYITDFFTGESSSIAYNIITVLVVIIAVVAVLWGAKGGGEGEKK